MRRQRDDIFVEGQREDHTDPELDKLGSCDQVLPIFSSSTKPINHGALYFNPTLKFLSGHCSTHLLPTPHLLTYGGEERKEGGYGQNIVTNLHFPSIPLGCYRHISNSYRLTNYNLRQRFHSSNLLILVTYLFVTCRTLRNMNKKCLSKRDRTS